MIPEENCSTKNRPLANFEYLFQYNGFDDLRQTFMRADDEFESYDPNTDTKTSRFLDEETLQFYYSTETFKEHYCSLLKRQYGLSCQNIDSHYYDLNPLDDIQIRNFFKRTISLLSYLITELERRSELNVYQENKEILNKLIKFIHIKYKEFLPIEMIEDMVDVNAIEVNEEDKDVVLNSASIEEKSSKNPYPYIFANDSSFYLFEKLFALYKDSKYQIADFSFIYRMMYNDGYILSHYKAQMFIDWIGKEPFKISLDKIKTIDNCSTKAKKDSYSTLKELIQLK